MSCCHNDRERSEGKIGEDSGMGFGRGIEDKFSVADDGNMASRCICVATRRSGTDERASKLIRG